MLVKQTAFNNILRTEVSSKLSYSLTIVFFPTNSLDKASELLFIFIRVCRGCTPFPTRRDRLFLVVYEASTVVSQLLNTCKTRRNSNSQNLRRVATPVFQTAEKKPPQSKVYLCGSLVQPSFCFYFLRKSCFYHLMFLLTWVRTDKHRWVDRYTHFYENNFSKPGARPQPAKHAWYKK